MSILSDVKEIQAKMREAMQNGPVTPYYTLPPSTKFMKWLNAALASEIICVLRYKQHYYMTTSGFIRSSCKGSSKNTGSMKRSIWNSSRIVSKQLGGVPLTLTQTASASEPFHPSRAATSGGPAA